MCRRSSGNARKTSDPFGADEHGQRVILKPHFLMSSFCERQFRSDDRLPYMPLSVIGHMYQ